MNSEKEQLILEIVTAIEESKKKEFQLTTNEKKSTMNIDKEKIEYVIGIDFGHGETSAAICPLQWDSDESMWESPTDITLEGNNKVVPSAITLLSDGRAYIGTSAFRPEFLKQAEVHVCFKKSPEDIDGESEKLMIRFMKEVYKLIRNSKSAELSDDNHVVYIATPSGWGKKEQELYKEMAERAGLPIAGVTKESRAAFVHGLSMRASGLSQKVRNGGIVFDMGSSTLDFTYMNNEKNDKLIDYGYPCGASYIEEYLYEQKHKENDVREFEKKYPELADYIKFLARQAKEEVYSMPEMKIRVTKNFEDLVDDDELDGKVKFVFQPGELNQQLSEAGYIKQIEDAMNDFVVNHINHAPIYGVFLTGGASRMDFIKPIVAKCFNIDEKAIARDEDPSLTISRGVAEVARMDLRTEGADVSLSEMIDELKSDDRIYDTFVETYSHALWDTMTDNMADTINGFKDSNVDLSLNALSARLENAVFETIREFGSEAPEFINKAIGEHTKEVEARVESIVKMYSSQGVNITIPRIYASAQIKMNANMTEVINNIRDTIASSSSDWTAAITAGAIGGAFAVLIGGPIAWIAAGTYALYKWFSGFSEEDKKKEAMKKKLNRSEREKVYSSIAEQWEKITNDVAQTINREVSQNKQLKQSINLAVNNRLEAYKQELKNARILVD